MHAEFNVTAAVNLHVFDSKNTTTFIQLKTRLLTHTHTFNISVCLYLSLSITTSDDSYHIALGSLI